MSFGIPVRNGLMLGLGASTALSTRAGAKPAMYLNFLSGVLDSRITFSRGTGATRVNELGLIELVGNTTPRFDYDPVTLAPRGLLIEEARTNLATYSDQFNNAAWTPTGATVSANVTASPDGTTNADKLVETAVTSDHHIDQNISFTTGTTYTFSFYAKAGERNVVAVRSSSAWAADPRIRFTLTGAGAVTVDNGTPTGTITAVGNGWYRCTMTATTNLTTTGVIRLSLYNGAYNYAGDGTSGLFLYGAQVEAGSFATSYIPTVASTVTRNADVATMTGTNFSSWYNQSEGTFVVDAATANAGVNFYTIGTGGSRIGIRRLASNTVLAYNRLGGTNDISANGPWATGTAKVAYAIKSGDSGISLNGSTVATNTNAFTQAETLLNIGSLDGTSDRVNGHIRTIAYFNTRLPNAQLQTLTAPSLATTLSLDFTSGSYNVGF